MQTPPPTEVEVLLQRLQDNDPRIIAQAIEEAAKHIASDEQLRQRITALQTDDPSDLVRETAKRVLASSKPSYIKPFYSEPDFWAGFFGWYIFNSIAFLIVSSSSGTGGGLSADILRTVAGLGLILSINLIAPIVAAFKRRFLAAGILTAFAINFAISIIIGAGWTAVCGLPFFAVWIRF